MVTGQLSARKQYLKRKEAETKEEREIRLEKYRNYMRKRREEENKC